MIRGPGLPLAYAGVSAINESRVANGVGRGGTTRMNSVTKTDASDHNTGCRPLFRSRGKTDRRQLPATEVESDPLAAVPYEAIARNPASGLPAQKSCLSACGKS